MGFFDFLSSIFGGGAKVEMSLEADRVPVGGILSGKATVTGAPKPATITSLKVRLLYVHVESQPDSALPKIDTRILIDHTIVANVALGAGEKIEHSFTLTIPPGTQPTGTGVSYNVMVVADIPGMKDPNAKKELKVIEGAAGGAASADALFGRWPALRGTAEQPLLDALRDMRWKHQEGDAENDLTVAEPVLSKLMREHDSMDVRQAAFEAWANIVSSHLRTEHVKLMGEVLKGVEKDEDVLRDVLAAMGPTMDLGGDALVKPYLSHGEDDVREAAVGALSWGRGGASRAQALLPLLSDESVRVRARAVGALGDYRDQPGVLDKLLELGINDRSSEVLQQSLSALALCWTDKKLIERVAPVYERARTHADPEVRKAYVNWIGWPARGGDISASIQGLLDDPDLAVQEAMAFEFCNLLRDHKQYGELCKAVIQSDRSDSVRGRAMGALDSFMKPEEVAEIYRKVVATGPSETLLYQMVQGIKFTTSPVLKDVLRELSHSDYSRVARAAKDAFESDYS